MNFNLQLYNLKYNNNETFNFIVRYLPAGCKLQQREELSSIVSKGKSASQTIKRAHVLLRLDSNADVKCAIDEMHKVLGILTIP